MSRSWKPSLFCVAVVVAVPGYAADVANTPVTQIGQDIASTETSALSASERVRSRAWGLSETEWRRYRQLMQGIRGSISPPTLSPIEVLGIHARNEAERQRYAEAWARAMHEDVDRTLAFQRAYDAAGKRLYPNKPLIDIDRLPRKTEQTNAFQSTDRLLFFARPACPVCDVMMNKLLQRIDEVSGIDIYLTDMQPGDDAAVRAWASTHRIDPESVRSRRIPLNHDGGALESLTSGQGEVPYILRQRGEDLSPLRAADL